MKGRRKHHARSAGVAVPLFSLRSERDSGIGEIFDLVPFIDWAAASGQSIVSLLPLGELGAAEASPYNAISSFAIDPLHVTLSELPELAGLDDVDRPQPRTLDRERVRARKAPLCAEAWRRFRRLPDGDARVRGFEAFRSEQASWLVDYSLFRALAEEREGEGWLRWPKSIRTREPQALSRVRARLRERIEFFEYLQFATEEQWWRVREHARSKGVALMGDLPFAPAENSADVWANQEVFDLSHSIGAPPDAFSQTGQRWGLPMYRWEELRRRRWRWFRERARRMAGLYDLFRIDHVVGLFRTFCFGPEGDGRFDPSERTAQEAQGREILAVLCAESAEATPVAEDLGTIPPYVRDCLRTLDIPGYKIFRWERTDGAFSDPRRYPECSIAATGTHDTETLAAWWAELSDGERSRIGDLIGASGPLAATLEPRLRRALLDLLYRSGSRYVILPIQDLFGWERRINAPATVGVENWSFRLPVKISELRSDPVLAEESRALRALIDGADRLGRMAASAG